VHVAVLNANTDRSTFARGWPDDAQKVISLLRQQRPHWRFSAWQACDGELPPAEFARGGGPDQDSPNAWVITGSVSSVTEEQPWMLALEQRVRERHAQRQRTAGLCFGHQLIAKALGGKVGPSPGGWRLGVATTALTGPALPWMQPALPRFDLYALHQDQVFVPPAGAQVLGGDTFTPCASLAVGDHLFTRQYHPELSQAFVLALLDAFAGSWPAGLVASARQQCTQPVDAERFIQWLVQFLQGRPVDALLPTPPTPASQAPSSQDPA
jgi:GMP synthase-like glutamine amidotransferase